MWSTAFGLWVGLAIGNFVWQIFTQRKWDVAIERSWFQAVALATFVLILSR